MLPYTFQAPNGVTYTISQRFVSTGNGIFSKHAVWDLTSSVTGVSHYRNETELAVALSNRLGLPVWKCERAIARIMSGETVKQQRTVTSAPDLGRTGVPTRPLSKEL